MVPVANPVSYPRGPLSREGGGAMKLNVIICLSSGRALGFIYDAVSEIFLVLILILLLCIEKLQTLDKTGIFWPYLATFDPTFLLALTLKTTRTLETPKNMLGLYRGLPV